MRKNSLISSNVFLITINAYLLKNDIKKLIWQNAILNNDIQIFNLETEAIEKIHLQTEAIEECGKTLKVTCTVTLESYYGVIVIEGCDRNS